MIQLEKPYQKERIPGLRQKVDRAVSRSLNASIDHTANNYDRTQRLEHIKSEYPNLTNEEVYALCPFSSFLDTCPDRSDWTGLYDFQKELDRRMKEDMTTWAKNVIKHLEKQLYPSTSLVSHLVN